MEFLCVFSVNAAVGLFVASSCLGGVPNESLIGETEGEPLGAALGEVVGDLVFLMEKTRSSLSLTLCSPDSQLHRQYNESMSYIKKNQQKNSV